jgi:hypothetical protein
MGRMLLSICAVVVALGLCGLQAPEPQGAARPSPAAEKQSADQSNGRREPEARPPLSVVIAETPAQTESREKGETEAREHERLDLIAQQKAADAAEAQVTPNRIAAVLTVFGTGALIWTLILTQQSLNLSRRTAIAELRAYVGIDTARCKNGGTHNADWDFIVQIKNFGATPAKNLRVHLKPVTKTGKARRVGKETYFASLPPTQVVRPSLKVPVAEVRRGMGGATTYWWVSWGYTDAFGSHHSEGVMLSSEPSQWATGSVGMVHAAPKK